MPATGVNHVSVHADDLDESGRFYVEVFGMTELPAPNFGFPVRWFRLGDQQLHLFVRDDSTAPAFHHFGMDVHDFEETYRRVRERTGRDPTLVELPGGVVQMYLHDPAGNLIEVDWPDIATLDRAALGPITRLADNVPQSEENLRARLYLDRAR
jgi:catechol 2,3-dioxygenase-like lactoylglutathione lyase family enzyme